MTDAERIRIYRNWTTLVRLNPRRFRIVWKELCGSHAPDLEELVQRKARGGVRWQRWETIERLPFWTPPGAKAPNAFMRALL